MTLLAKEQRPFPTERGVVLGSNISSLAFHQACLDLFLHSIGDYHLCRQESLQNCLLEVLQGETCCGPEDKLHQYSPNLGHSYSHSQLQGQTEDCMRAQESPKLLSTCT